MTGPERSDAAALDRSAVEDWARTADVIQDPLAITDANGIVRRANRVFRERFAAGAGTVAGGAITSFLFRRGQDREEVGAAYANYEASDLRIPGTFLISQRPMDLSSGPALLYHLTDVSALRAAEAAARASEAQARQAQKMEAVGRLGAGVAHDFNNLLTAVLCNAELLLPYCAREPDAIEIVSRIRTAGERGAVLVRRLLDFSRPQPGRPETLDVNAHLSDGAKLLWRMVGNHIRVDVRCGETPAWVRFDPTQFEQVLLNLALNARDAMPEGGVLTVRTDTESMADRPMVVVSVTDTGVGMNDEVQARVFEPFFTTKEAGRGTGLGLAMVHAIVSQAGGQILIHSQPGVGTTVQLRFPALVAEPVEAEAVVEVVPVGGTGTVLLVDDEEASRLAIAAALRALGYQVLIAADAAQALALAEQHTGGIDLVLSDVVMPGMTGSELGRIVAERWPSLRVLLMSGHSADQAPDGARVLAKPFSLGELARVAGEILG